MNTANAPLQPLQVQTVYGLQIHDNRLAALTKKVLTLACISAVLMIANQIVTIAAQGGSLQPRTLGLAVLAIACGLLVPCCGYFGAKNSDQNLTCCFCGCNCLGCVFTIINVGVLFMTVSLIKYVLDTCGPGSTDPNCQNINWSQLCPNLPEDECYTHLQDTEHNLQILTGVSVICAIPTCLLQTLSFWFGKQLYDELQAGRTIVQAPLAPAMATVAVQPIQQMA